MQPGHAVGLAAEKADDPLFPVDVLRLQHRQIRLRGAEVPRQLVKRPPFQILFPLDDLEMFRQRDGALFLKHRLGPLLARQQHLGQPAHIQREVLEPAQIHVRGHRAGAQDFQEMFGPRLQQRQIANGVKGMIAPGRDVAMARVIRLGRGHFIHHEAPGARGGGGIGGAEVSQGNLLIEDRLAMRLVLGMEQGLGGGFVPGAEALLFAGLGVFAIENPVATVEQEL